MATAIIGFLVLGLLAVMFMWTEHKLARSRRKLQEDLDKYVREHGEDGYTRALRMLIRR